MIDNARDFKGYDGIFAKRLRQIMDSEKMTQEALAKQTGLTRQTISQYMDGSVLPNAEKLCKICVFFDIPSDYFLGLIDSQSKDISTQYIQSTIGLSDGAIKILAEIYHGHNQLFSTPFDIGIINYMLSNEQFVDSFLKRLSSYFAERLSDDDNARRTNRFEVGEKTDMAKVLVGVIFERMAEECYTDYYKPTFLEKQSKKKPGRKRKEAVGGDSRTEENIG